MSEVEPEIRAFLIRIVQTISMGILWLLLNMTFGIYFSLAFFEGHPTIGNYIYYVFFLISLAALIFYFIKKWKHHL
jgi:ABC-type uncharacterized transport system permease subunit